MTQLKLILTSAAFASFGAFALAHAGSASETFNKIDGNADGIVSQAEFVSYKTASGKVSATEAAEKFAALAGSDGELTLAELETAMEPKVKDHDCSKSKDKTA